MPDTPSSPPKGLSSSPSIFAYQTRLLDRTSPVSRSSPTVKPGLAGLTDDSPPSTPIRRNVARMAAGLESGPMRSSRGHAAGKSIDLVRNKWEARSNDAGQENVATTPKAVKRNTWMAPSTASPEKVREQRESRANDDSSTEGASGSTPKAMKRNTLMTTPSTISSGTSASPESISTPNSTTRDDSLSQFKSSFMASKAARSDKEPLSSTLIDKRLPRPHSASERLPNPDSNLSSSSSIIRPASIASAASILSPISTGNSSVTSTRSQAMEDTLAQARANALKRLEARKKAQAASGAGGQDESAFTVKGDSADKATIKADAIRSAIPPPTPTTTAAPFLPALTPSTPPRSVTETKNGFPFDRILTPPSTEEIAAIAAEDATPKSRSTLRSIATPPSASPSRYIPSGLGSSNPASSFGAGPSGGKDKYGSLSKTDRRRLGRHLPRIASGGEGWDGDEASAPQQSTGRRVPSSLGQSTVPAGPTSPKSERVIAKTSSLEVLAPSFQDNKPSVVAQNTPPPSTPSKRRSAFMAGISKEKIESVLQSPKQELQGEDMKSLMSAVGALPARPKAGKDDGDGVTGMSNRLRLSRNVLPPSATSAAVAPAPLPSRRLLQTNWMERQRHALASYEYLCHVGEALQWIEGCLDEEVGFGVVEMEDGLRDGVVLAKLARCFMGDQVVKSIWTESKHRYKQTDNINHFLKLVRSVGMPEIFMFDMTDLYNKKNIPKVIFCIHVLSHLLAKLGRAERIGNLVGQFEFTDEQLAATQKGLQGVVMPNFGDAKASLAKEASWEPEEPEETEDEIRDRKLLECEASIRSLQHHLRGQLARQRTSRTYSQLDLAGSTVIAFQARARGVLDRRALVAEHEERIKLGSWAIRVQTAARARLARQRCSRRMQQFHSAARFAIPLQAHARGVLVRQCKGREVNALDKAKKSVVGLQAVARGKLARKQIHSARSQITKPEVIDSVTSLQSTLRGRLVRSSRAQQVTKLQGQAVTFIALQSHLRGALVRRSKQAEEERLVDANDIVIALQAVCRGILARRKKQTLVKAVQVAMPTLSSLQAVARARLAKQSHQSMQKALAKVEVAGSVGGLQAFLRTKLAKRQTTEQKKKLEFVSPDVIGFQAQARGYLARQDYNEWREYLYDPHTQGALVFLQSLVRGFLARRRLWLRTSHYHFNQHQIVKVQSLWRGRVQRRMYDKLLTGVDVDVPTIQNYMHLLNDTESDFTDQIRTETLRKEVIDLVRENQALETEVAELETKIALIVKNTATFEQLAKAKRKPGHSDGKTDTFVLPGSHDPFSGQHLDKVTQRKLELFEHLFFALQTKPDYMVRLIRSLNQSDREKDTRSVQAVALVLFGSGQDKREEYLFHKLVQLSSHTDVLLSQSLPSLIDSRFFLAPLTSAYLKDPLSAYLQEVLTPHVMRVVETPDLDLRTDPLEIYQRLINEEESRTGLPSPKPRDRDADQVLQTDADARAHYIAHLQALRFFTAELMKTLYATTVMIPYTIRYLAREAMLALRVKFPDALDEDLTPAVARTFILPFILPALIAPETWGITDLPISPAERRNLAAISNLIGHIAYPEADLTGPLAKPGDRFQRVPLHEFIRTESALFRDWVIEVASVDPLETYFESYELYESTLEARPITITRTDIYSTLSVLMKNIPTLTAKKSQDPIALILEELEGPPIEYDKSNATVSLRLTNRLADLQPGDNETQMKEDFVQAKRHVLAVLRVQSGRTLYDVLVARPEEVNEVQWLEEVHRDLALEQARAAMLDIPQTPAEANYQIESIRSLPFHEVKSRAIEFCMKLERGGKITRKDAYQGLLVSIASDIRQKHHLRKMLRQSLAAMRKAHEDMSAKKKGFEESITSYHTFIDSSMANLQKGKKRPIFMSKQYRHQKYEEKMGKRAQFGSYKYTAHDLYEKGILLGISQFSPRQYDRIHIVIASNEVGVFSLEMSAPPGQFANPVMGHEEVRMEDLLQAQFDNELNLLLFEGMATFSINMLIQQINRKFYST